MWTRWYSGARLKLTKFLRAPLLPNVLKKRINDGAFPYNLRIAKVVPIFKSRDSEIPTNYRPLSILTYLSKIFEKVLHTRLNDYFIKNNLLSQQQYGFRNSHYVSLDIADLYENLLQTSIKTYISCGPLRSNKSIWLSESLHIADKIWAMCKRKHV